MAETIDPSARRARWSKSVHGFPVAVEIDIDGSGKHSIRTGIGFLDHCLELFCRYGDFNLDLTCEGDLQVDDHHTVDEVALALGCAFSEAIKCGGGKAINRTGFSIVPMDEVLTIVSLDICGRSSLTYDAKMRREQLGGMSVEMFGEFWRMFSQKVPLCLIIKSEYGRNDHHVVEGIFKCVARALKSACAFK